MMGFETDYAKSTRHSAFGELQTSFVLTNVACNGTEDSIRDCASKSHFEEVCDPIFEDCSPKPPLIIDGCGTANVGGVVCYSK